MEKENSKNNDRASKKDEDEQFWGAGVLGVLERRFGGMGWGQVMESPGPHAGRSLLSEEQWKGRSREGGCEERNVTAGQGGNRLQHLSITHAERPGNVKEDRGKCE